MDEQTTVTSPSATEELRELQEAIAALEAEYQRLHARYTELTQLRKTAPGDRNIYIDYLMVSDQMTLVLHDLEALKPQLFYAEAKAAVAEGKSHYDALVPAVTEATELLCQRWALFIQACQGFVEMTEQQVRGLWSLPSADGTPAFELPGGQELLQRVIGGLPNTSGTVYQAVVWTMQTPLTVGESRRAVASVPGTQPFSETAVAQFLTGYEPPTPEGTSPNGSR
jgi:hypothetical protein